MCGKLQTDKRFDVGTIGLRPGLASLAISPDHMQMYVTQGSEFKARPYSPYSGLSLVPSQTRGNHD